MDGYKTLNEAVAEASKIAKKWKYVGNGNEFNIDELYEFSKLYDQMSEPDGWNYFAVFNEGCICLLTMPMNDVDPLFIPVE